MVFHLQNANNNNNDVEVGAFIHSLSCHLKDVNDAILSPPSNPDLPQVLKAPHLKRLHCLLLQLSLDTSLHQYKFDNTISMGIWNDWFVVNLTFVDIVHLSDILFKEVHRRFEHLFTGISFLPSIAPTQSGQQSDILISPEDLSLLLRCCISILPLLEFDQSLVLEKCQILLTILKRLCSLDLMVAVAHYKVKNGRSIIRFKKSVSCECTFTFDGTVSCIHEELDAAIHFAEQDGSLITLLCSILEVFADELLVHRCLKNHFIEINRVSHSSEKSFLCQGGHGDIVLEVLSAHFLSSVSGELGINRFPDTLFWSCGKDFEIPHLSLTGAVAMLSSSAVFDAPQALQAHLISLVSRCIGIQMSPVSMEVNSLLLSNYMFAFELSANLYSKHISSLHIGLQIMEPCVLDSGTELTFESYMNPEICNRLSIQLGKLADPFHPCIRYLSSRTKSDLLNSSVEYIKMNQSIIDKSCRDEACLILNWIVETTLYEETWVKESRQYEEINQQELYLVAAALMLMSCSLLQIVWFMRHCARMGLKSLKDIPYCQEHGFITAIISRFGKDIASQPTQKILLDVMGKYPSRHMDTKLMLVHFAGMLKFSFDAGPDFLWKGCIFFMMSLMNLLAFEEGNLNALRPLLGCKEKTCFSQSSTKLLQGLTCQTSSLMVASNLQKIQTLYIQVRSTKRVDSHSISLIETSDDQVRNQNTPHFADLEESEHIVEESDTCSGEVFLKCLNVPSKYDDLADFIECKSGKDYSSWMKQREMYRKWKCEKLGICRIERKNRLLKYRRGTSRRRRPQK